MTTIRDLPAPALDGEFRQPREREGKAKSNSWLVATLCASAIAVTLLNVLASVYLYKADSEIRAVERKLAELPEFETRMKERLDLVNTGVQSRFDNLNRDIEARLTTISSVLGQLQRASATIEGRKQEGLYASDGAAIDTESTLSVSEFNPAETQKEPGLPPPPRDNAPFVGQAKLAPTVSPSYKRIETADGKVYYRKVH